MADLQLAVQSAVDDLIDSGLEVGVQVAVVGIKITYTAAILGAIQYSHYRKRYSVRRLAHHINALLTKGIP